MNVAIFSSKPYEKEYLDNANLGIGHHLHYFDATLNADTINLARGFDAVCLFVTDTLDKKTTQQLAEMGNKID